MQARDNLVHLFPKVWAQQSHAVHSSLQLQLQHDVPDAVTIQGSHSLSGILCLIIQAALQMLDANPYLPDTEIDDAIEFDGIA